jgi:hypothetical protein
MQFSNIPSIATACRARSSSSARRTSRRRSSPRRGGGRCTARWPMRAISSAGSRSSLAMAPPCHRPARKSSPSEALAAPVATTLGARGLIPTTRRLSVGVAGSYSAPPANRIVHRADLVLFIGCDTGDQVTMAPGRPICVRPARSAGPFRKSSVMSQGAHATGGHCWPSGNHWSITPGTPTSAIHWPGFPPWCAGDLSAGVVSGLDDATVAASPCPGAAYFLPCRSRSGMLLSCGHRGAVHDASCWRLKAERTKHHERL